MKGTVKMKLYELCILQGTTITVVGIYSTLEQTEENENILKKSFSLLEDNQRTTFTRVICTDVPVIPLKYATVRITLIEDNQMVKIVNAKIIDIESIADTSNTVIQNTLKGKTFARTNVYNSLNTKVTKYVDIIVEIEKGDTQ